MFDYTKGVFLKTVNDLKKIAFCFTCAVHVFQIVYLIYALCAPTGIFAVNVILLALCIAHFIFSIYKHGNEIKKSTKKAVRRTYKWAKRFLKLLTLSISVYGLFFSLSQPLTKMSALSLIVLIFSLLCWTLGFLFDILILIAEKRITLFINAFKLDTESAWKVGNFINKLKGKEVDDEIVSAETRDELANIKAPSPTKEEKREEWKNVFHNLKNMIFRKK